MSEARRFWSLVHNAMWGDSEGMVSGEVTKYAVTPARLAATVEVGV
jgi:hypothetical protein